MMSIGIASVQLNHASILTKIMRAERTKAAAFAKAQKRFEVAKQDLLREFDSHPVTQELLAGPNVPSSNLLPETYGNLFSFLGFDKNKPNPIGPIRKLLENIHLLKTPIVGREDFSFKIKLPTVERLEEASPMEWESGRSWINAITYGMGTFSHYMFNIKAGRFPQSQSGTGIQVKPSLRSTSTYLTGRGYVIGMLGNFRKKMQR